MARLAIQSMAFKGYGLARLDGKILFVSYAVTGDEVEAEIIQERKDYAVAKLVHLLKPSPWRVEPRCPYFGTCGGCQWQHIDYGVQAELKRRILEETLTRLGRLKEIPSIEVVPSPRFYDYRTRVQFKVKGKMLGFFAERSYRVVDIRSCPIADPLINQILLFLRQSHPLFRSVNEIEVNISPGSGHGVLIVHPLVFDQGMRKALQGFLRTHPTLKGIAVTTAGRLEILGDPYLTYTISIPAEGPPGNLLLRTSPESFFQVNLEQNQRLIDTVLQFADLRGEEEVLDLYAGVGNLTLPLALSSQSALGIEGNRTAAEDARFNAERNGIENCRFVHGKVEEVLPTLGREKIDVAVVDPPRTGCKAAVRALIGLCPRRIVYVSCNPATLARDLYLFATHGYSPQAIRLLDFFPQSYHMEAVAALRSPYSGDTR
jgi:23S rRNA (uracil1939-C5)-methyltransferase